MGKKLQSIELTKLPTNPNEYAYQNSGIDVKAVERKQLQALRGWRTFDEDVNDQYDNEFEEKRNQGYIIKGSFWLSPKQQIRADVSAISEDPTSGEWINNDGLGDLPERHPFIEEHYEFPDWVGRPQ